MSRFSRVSSLRISVPPRSTLFPYTTLFRSFEFPFRRRAGFREVERVNVVRKRRDDVHRSVDDQRRSLVSAKQDRKSTRLNSSHVSISYAVFCLKKKK